MKIILSLLILFSACKSGMQKDHLSFKDFEPMQGNWFGIQMVLFNDDSTGFNYPSKVTVALLKDSVEINMTNTYADGHQETEKGILSINKNGSILSLGASEYDVKDVIRTKDELAIFAYKEGEDNDRPATIRLQIVIRAKVMAVFKHIKYDGSEDYFTRISLSLSKK